jgi:hypothetical protein
MKSHRHVSGNCTYFSEDGSIITHEEFDRKFKEYCARFDNGEDNVEEFQAFIHKQLNIPEVRVDFNLYAERMKHIDELVEENRKNRSKGSRK